MSGRGGGEGIKGFRGGEGCKGFRGGEGCKGSEGSEGRLLRGRWVYDVVNSIWEEIGEKGDEEKRGEGFNVRV